MENLEQGSGCGFYPRLNPLYSEERSLDLSVPGTDSNPHPFFGLHQQTDLKSHYSEQDKYHNSLKYLIIHGGFLIEGRVTHQQYSPNLLQAEA